MVCLLAGGGAAQRTAIDATSISISRDHTDALAFPGLGGAPGSRGSFAPRGFPRTDFEPSASARGRAPGTSPGERGSGRARARAPAGGMADGASAPSSRPAAGAPASCSRQHGTGTAAAGGASPQQDEGAQLVLRRRLSARQLARMRAGRGSARQAYSAPDRLPRLRPLRCIFAAPGARLCPNFRVCCRS
jgi:hypothetical protein